ncbi:MAG: sugar/nucleoside kinase (ribokinase family) [Patiriisocius sp.]|jgi:sugar/nucleoside kinase (ribokinase family)
MSIISVGTVAFDAIETPFGKRDKVVGGAATYISLAASFFHQPVNLISVIGDDYDQETLSKMRARNINLDGLQVKEGEKSFFWSGKYHYDLNTRDTLETQLNVLENFDPVVPESYQDSEYVMLGNLAPAVQQSVIKQMKKRPKLIVMDTMNFWMDIAMDELKETIGMVDVLSINDEEARQLSGEYSLVTAAMEILAMGPKYLIIKKGEHGALLFDKNQVFFAPALPLELVMDPTGAGDTFAGGFMGYIASKNDISFDTMKNGIIAGSALASFTCEKFGPERLLEIDSSDIKKRIAEFESLIKFNFDLDALLD